MTRPVDLGAAGATLPSSRDPVALARNENPFPPLPSVRTAIVEATAAVNRYPEFFPFQLRALIAGQIRAHEDQLIVGAGATGVIIEVLRALTRPGDRIVMGSPTFDGYPIFARIAGLVPVGVPLDASGHHDLDAMAEAADSARVVAVCRPHNPTGTVDDERELRAFLSRIAPYTVVLLDEAYVEFVSPALRLDVAELIRDFPNVVVVRTFSKAYGLAALRVGYGISAPAVARRIWANNPPFGTSFLAVAAVAASFGAQEELEHRIAAITTERAHLRTRLSRLGLATTDSHANFVFLADHGHSWPDVFGAAGVQVRAIADHGVRITVGDRSSTSAVLAAVETAAVAAP